MNKDKPKKTQYELQTGLQEKLQTGLVATRQPQVKQKFASISSQFAGKMAEHQLSLFDPEQLNDYVKQPDYLKDLLDEIREQDIKLSIDRKGKSIFLTNIQYRIVRELSGYLTQYHKYDPDVQMKIKNPYNSKITVEKKVPLEYLAKNVFGRTKAEQIRKIDAELRKIALVKQYIASDKFHKYFATPLIQIGDEYGEIKITDGEKWKNWLIIKYGGFFFEHLNTYFAPITEKLRLAGRKKGRGTKLYATLEQIAINRWGQYIAKRNNKRDEIRNDKKNKRLKDIQLYQKLQTAIGEENMLAYSITVDELIRKTGNDYDSRKQYKKHFWNDLENARQGLIEAEILTDIRISESGKLVTLIINPDYAKEIIEKETELSLTKK